MQSWAHHRLFKTCACYSKAFHNISISKLRKTIWAYSSVAGWMLFCYFGSTKEPYFSWEYAFWGQSSDIQRFCSQTQEDARNSVRDPQGKKLVEQLWGLSNGQKLSKLLSTTYWGSGSHILHHVPVSLVSRVGRPVKVASEDSSLSWVREPFAWAFLQDYVRGSLQSDPKMLFLSKTEACDSY